MVKSPFIIFKNGRISPGGAYDGEKIPGDLGSMNVLSSDANEVLGSSYGLLSKRSGTLYHTYGPVRAAVNKQTDYAIGPGLAFRSQPDWSLIPGMNKESAKSWGKDFQKIIHYYFQVMEYYEKQQTLFRGALTFGDTIQIFERIGGELNDIIDFNGDHIDCDYNDKDYFLGIKHDKYLRAKGIRKVDETEIDFVNGSGDLNLIQYFNREQPRQLRGYPLAYSIINLAKNDDRHMDATVQRAVLESIMVGTWEVDQTNPAMQVQNQALANLKKAQKTTQASSSSGNGIFSKIANAFNLGAGNMYTLRKGEKMSFTDLKTPNPNFGPFKEAVLGYIGAATGTPPEVILSKYSTSYTAHRGALNDFRKSYMLKRVNFQRRVMMPTITEIAKDAILKGWISAPGFFENPRIRMAYMQGNYLGPVPGSINPVQEANANKTNVEQAFKLRSDVAAETGNEYDNMIQQWHEEQDEFLKREVTEKDVENDN